MYIPSGQIGSNAPQAANVLPMPPSLFQELHERVAKLTQQASNTLDTQNALIGRLFGTGSGKDTSNPKPNRAGSHGQLLDRLDELENLLLDIRNSADELSKIA